MPSNLKKVAVIGTGVIGAGWIVRCLAHNKKVIAYDKNFNSYAPGLSHVGAYQVSGKPFVTGGIDVGAATVGGHPL